MSNVNIQINVNTTQAVAAISRLDRATQGLRSDMKGVRNSAEKTSKSMRGFGLSLNKVGKIATSFVAFKVVQLSLSALRSSVGATVGTFIDYEKALIGVAKTTDLTDDEIKALGLSLEQLSTEIPVSSKELLNLAEVAGQLGVKGSSNLKKFAETGARLARSTVIAGDVAVKSLARIIGITKDSLGNVDRLGASLVQLGNTFKANEDEILSAASAIAQSTAGFGLASEEILGIAAAVKEAGLGSQKAGTAIGKLFNDISIGAAKGSESAVNFAKLLGLSLDQLQTQLKDDAAGTFNSFIQSLVRAQKEGKDLSLVLADVGIKNQRSIQVIRSLTAINDRLNVGLQSSKQAYEENQALVEESDKAFATLGSAIETAQGSFLRLGRILGEISSGPLSAFISDLADATDAIAGLFSEDKALTEAEELDIKIKELNRTLNGTLLGIANFGKATGLAGVIVGFTGKSYEELNEQLRIQSEELAKLTIRRAELTKEEEKAGTTIAKKTESTTEDHLIKEFDLMKAFAEAENTFTEEEQTAGLLQASEFQLAQFDQLKAAFGAEEAFKIAARAKSIAGEMGDEKKRQDALLFLKKKGVEAEKKLKDEEARLDEQKVRDRKSTFIKISTLSQSHNKTLAGIGKAAAITQIAIDGPQAITKALAAFPPPFNFAAAALVGAAVAAQAANVAGVKFEDGGIVPGNSFSGDNVVANVNSGEMILNSQQQAQLFSQANGQGSGNQSREIVVNTTVELDGEAIGRSVSRQVADGLELGEVV